MPLRPLLIKININPIAQEAILLMSTSIQEHCYERKAAVTTGITLIIMALAAFFSYTYIHGKLVVPGDASTTFNQITASYGLFKAEILGWVIILISDVVVSWGLYVFLKPIHQNLSLLGACLRLTYLYWASPF